MMHQISWLEATRDPECLKCRLAGKEGVTMRRQFHPREQRACPQCGAEAQEKAKFCPDCGVKLPPVEDFLVLDFVCDACGDKKGPYAVRVNENGQGDAQVVVVPGPEAVEAVTKPAPKRKSPLDVPKEKTPLTQDELIEFCESKFPAVLSFEGIEFPRVIKRWQETFNPNAGPVQGVKVSYGQARGAPGARNLLRFDNEETFLCQDGEPDVEASLSMFEKQIQLQTVGLPNEIRKIVRVQRAKQRIICGECSSQGVRVYTDECQHGGSLTQRQMNSSAAPGADPDKLPGFGSVLRKW
jgi:hypothetical protein